MSFVYDHLDIKELATVEREYTDATGRVRIERHIDRKKLHALMMQRAQEGRRVMEPFRHWLILSRAYAADKAERRAHLVFVALWETRNKPIEKLAREDLSVPRREELRGALMHFCEWLISSSTDEDDKRWGRDLLSALSRLKAISKRVNVKKKEREGRISTTALPPFNDDQWQAVFEVLESWHKRMGARYPWARPLMRMQMINALPINSEGILLLERAQLLELIDSPKNEKVLRLWNKRNKSLMIPFEFLQDEAADLLRIPAAWGVVADLISADCEGLEKRLRTARVRLLSVWKRFREWGMQDLPEVFGDAHYANRMRNTAIRVLWEKTQDLLLVAGMTGVPVQLLCSYYEFIRTGRERVEAFGGRWVR